LLGISSQLHANGMKTSLRVQTDRYLNWLLTPQLWRTHIPIHGAPPRFFSRGQSTICLQTQV
jgi:hypothetical protein